MHIIIKFITYVVHVTFMFHMLHADSGFLSGVPSESSLRNKRQDWKPIYESLTKDETFKQ